MAEAIDALKRLNTVLVDSLNGYNEAFKDANLSEMAPLFADMITFRTRQVAELNAKLIATGECVDNSGSYMSLVHKTVIGIRAAVLGLDASVLPAFIGGEKRILDAYDEALSKAPQYRAFIQAQKQELLNVIQEMERIKSAA
jgi:uncharacterized protein (TIGR02284 family)